MIKKELNKIKLMATKKIKGIAKEGEYLHHESTIYIGNIIFNPIFFNFGTMQ